MDEKSVGDFAFIVFTLIIFITGISIGQTIGEKGSLLRAGNLSKCCVGGSCTDTYLGEDGLCHLVLCENNFLILAVNKSQCTYEPIAVP